MKPKTKKSQMKKQPKKKAGKMMKDKSVKQEVRVNVQSSGGGGSGGSSIPSTQPFQQPILSAFKQAEKTGENVDIKNLITAVNKLGVGLSEKNANNQFQNIINNENINRPQIQKEAENINYDDNLEQAEETNNQNIVTIEDVKKTNRGGKRAGAGRPKKVNVDLNVDFEKPIVGGMLGDMVDLVDLNWDIKETPEEKRKREEITPELIEEYKKKLFY